jgi:hypothetical protein
MRLWRIFVASFKDAYRRVRQRAQPARSDWVLWRACDSSLHSFRLEGQGATHHIADGTPCWCGPSFQCARCEVVAPCIHGPRRIEIVVHKQAS